MPQHPTLPRRSFAATVDGSSATYRVNAMASRIVERLRDEALNLPGAERAELACNLVQSLDGPPDTGVAEEWDTEILRRLDQIASGTAQIIDRAEFTRRVRARMARRR
jgi:putative addiction module component (TIGR02574 family)